MQTILITGATGSFGQAFAHTYAAQGAQLILAGRQEKTLKTFAETLENRYGIETGLIVLDYWNFSPEAAIALKAELQAAYPSLTGIIHAAAYLGVRADLAQYPAWEWLKVFQVLVHGPFLLTQTLLPLCATQANLIFMNSYWPNSEGAYWGAYGVAQAAVKKMVETLAVEQPQLNLQSYAPGPTFSRLYAKAYPADIDPNLLFPDQRLVRDLENRVLTL